MIRPPQAIELHIDELVLHGFAPGDRQRIAEGVEHELGRLLTQRGLSLAADSAFHFDQLDGGSLRLPAPAPGPAGQAQVGATQIAAALFVATTSAVAPAEGPAAASLSAGDVTR